MFVQDLLIGFRALRRAPAFSMAAILTLAFGIGGTSAVFTIVNAILLRPLPYRAAERLAVVQHSAPGLGLTETSLSDATYLHYRNESRVLEDMGFYYENVVNVTGAGDAERVQIAMASPSLLTTLGARVVRGRLFAPDDLAAGPDDVVPVLISHELWTRRFGGDQDIVGRVIRLNSAPRQVIGVLERGFHFPRPETNIWFADRLNPARISFTDFSYTTVARLKPGVSHADAEAELNRLNLQLSAAFPIVTPQLLTNAQLTTTVTPLSRVVVGDVVSALWLLFGGMGLVLLIACTNVANLFLVRTEHRQKEIIVRSALGASRGALIRYFLSESLLIGATAGALGLFIADSAAQLLVAFGPPTLPRLQEIRVDNVVLIFTAGLAVATALVFAGVSAVRFGRPQLGAGLRQFAFGATAAAKRQRMRHLLVVAQIALALILVTASTLMVQSFWKLRQLKPGFDYENVLTAEIALPFQRSSAAFWQRLLDQLRVLPGVRAAGAVSGVPLVPVPEYYNSSLEIAGVPDKPGVTRPIGTVYFVEPGYFETLGIPLVEGRPLTNTAANASSEVLISAALAHRLFPGQSALGRRLRVAERDSMWSTIVGVTGDVPQRELAGDAAELLYMPISAHSAPSHLTITLRTSVPALTVAPALRAVTRQLDPELPLANVRTLERIVHNSMARTSFVMVTLSIAGVLALFLGAIGIYGVIAYTISRRLHEIGVRIALGAQASHIRALILRRATQVSLIGIAIGLAASIGLTRLLRSLLFDVSPTDPLTLTGTATLLLVIALFAAWIPTRRVLRTQPLTVLRLD